MTGFYAFEESLVVAAAPGTLLPEVFERFLVDPDDDDIVSDGFIIQRLSFHAIVDPSLHTIKQSEVMEQKNSAARKKQSDNTGFVGEFAHGIIVSCYQNPSRSR